MVRALFLVEEDNAARQAVLRFCTHPWFDSFILAVILGNACMMAMEDPTQPGLVDPTTEALELACNVVFTVELLSKIFAYGLVIGEGTYLRSGWNILDFVIVVSAWLPYFINSDSGTGALRTFRVLRPLRTISRFPGLKNLVVTIFMAAPQLQLLLIVVLLFFVTFGVVAIQLWKGKLRQRCQEPGGISQFCSVGGSMNATELCPCVFEKHNCGGAFCDVLDPESCAAVGSGGSVCAEAPWNPYYDFASFDHIFASWVIVLQCITTTSWQDIMHKAQATTGVGSSLYYILIVFTGAYFLLNLFVAVLKEKFALSRSLLKLNESMFTGLDGAGNGRLSKNHISAAFSTKGATLSTKDLDGCFDAMDADGTDEVGTAEFLKWLRSGDDLAQELRRRLGAIERAVWGGGGAKLTPDALVRMTDPATPNAERTRLKLEVALRGGLDFIRTFQVHDLDQTGELTLRQFKAVLRREAGILPHLMSDGELETVFAAVDADQTGGIYVDEFTKWLRRPARTESRPMATFSLKNKIQRGQSFDDESASQDDGQQKNSFDAESVSQKDGPQDGSQVARRESFDADIASQNDNSQDGSQVEDTGVEIAAWQQSLQDLIASSPFSTFFVLLIVINTVVLASDHHGISEELEGQLETINLFLTLVFTAELIIKIAAYQDSFHKDPFNVFDSFVVTTGMIELMIDSNTMSAFRIFRMLRLLRVLRLISFLKPLRTIARVIVVTTSGMAYIGILLSLFMFIFAICGMQLFGGQFSFPRQDKPLWNFDTFPIAFMTCFQIITYDTWDWVMLDGMRAIGWGASFFFILWIVVGALVLRNLLLVIILETYVIVSRSIEQEDKRASDNAAAEAMLTGDILMDVSGDDGSADGGAVEMKSCLIFAPSSQFRQLCVVVAESVWTDYVILTCILLNCVTMSMDTPGLDENGNLATSIYWAGVIFTIIFSFESLVKMIAHGILAPAETAYLASGWNRLDFAILGIAWLDLMAASANVGALKALRALRTLRVLNKIEGLRVLVLALLDAIAALTNVAGLTFIMWLIFGICCVNYLKGAFWSCNDSSAFVFGRDTCTGSVVMIDGKVTARTWFNPATNFDHIGTALFSLFEISMGEWTRVAHACIAAVGIDVQPRPGYNQIWTVPFMLFVLMSNLFFMNLFVGVIYDKYFQRKYDGMEELSQEQREFLAIMQMISSRTFVPEQVQLADSKTSSSGLRATCYSIATSSKLDHTILAAIVLNCVLMAATFHDEPQWWVAAQFWLNQAFTLMFTFECVVKLAGFGWEQYWADPWNKFDLIVVLGSWLDVMVTLLEVQFVSAALFRIIRIARVIGRLGRLFKGLKTLAGIDTIVNTFIQALPALSYITLFIALEIFIFAVIAMNLFGRVKFNGCMNAYRNFQNIPRGMLTLFGMATKDDAVCIVHACMLETDCDAELGECGSALGARIFYLLFDFTIMVTTIEMFVNVILAKYEELAERDALPVNVHHLEAFREAWKTVDPSAEHWISHDDVQRLLDQLPRQIGFDEMSGEDDIQLHELRLPSLPDGTKGGFLEATSIETDTETVCPANTGNEERAKAMIVSSNPIYADTNVDSQSDDGDDVTTDAQGPIGRTGYNFYEVLYGLVDRKCGVPLPAENTLCSTARMRMCLQTPALRRAAVQQRDAKRTKKARRVKLGSTATSRDHLMSEDMIQSADAG